MGKVIRAIRNKKRLTRRTDNKIRPKYPIVSSSQQMVVKDLIHQRGEGAPLALVEIERKKYHLTATEGIHVGQTLGFNDKDEISIGSILRLKDIPEGSSVHSIERKANDGGFFAMKAGTKGVIENHRKEDNETVIKLPSGVKKIFSSDNRAIIGIVSSAGIKEKPLLKAGNAFYLARSRGKRWPKVSGIAMNPVDHPFGGGNHQHIGFPSTVSKNAPEGQRVGLVGARRTGRKSGSKK